MAHLLRASLLLLVSAALLGACAAVPEDDPQAATAASSTGEVCGPVETPPLQAGSHLIGDAEPPVPFSSTPPTSGWHASGAMDVGIHSADDPLSEAEQVSVLEADGAVVTYRDLPADDLSALEDLVRGGYDGRVALSPYPSLGRGQVAVTAWGTLQRCDGLDLAAVQAFLDQHVGDDVVPGHDH